MRWRDRAHCFAIVAQIVRRILMNHARDRAAGKLGGGAQRIPLDEVATISDGRADQTRKLEI